jgi:RimJ/RimL family protein N-acetyltransferase
VAVARRAGCGALRLDAFTGNAPSLRLYQTLGYEDVGQVRFRKGLFRCFEKALAHAEGSPP